MGSKCPVCGGKMFPGVSITDCLTKTCAFRCNLENLPSIAAAMKLARAEYALEHCEPQHEHEHQFHLQIAQEQVLKVFGGKQDGK